MTIKNVECNMHPMEDDECKIINDLEHGHFGNEGLAWGKHFMLKFDITCVKEGIV